jgi:hypothetical protein
MKKSNLLVSSVVAGLMLGGASFTAHANHKKGHHDEMCKDEAQGCKMHKDGKGKAKGAKHDKNACDGPNGCDGDSGSMKKDDKK